MVNTRVKEVDKEVNGLNNSEYCKIHNNGNSSYYQPSRQVVIPFFNISPEEGYNKERNEFNEMMYQLKGNVCGVK